jgi:hypothetical protein
MGLRPTRHIHPHGPQPHPLASVYKSLPVALGGSATPVRHRFTEPHRRSWMLRPQQGVLPFPAGALKMTVSCQRWIRYTNVTPRCSTACLPEHSSADTVWAPATPRNFCPTQGFDPSGSSAIPGSLHVAPRLSPGTPHLLRTLGLCLIQ